LTTDILFVILLLTFFRRNEMLNKNFINLTKINGELNLDIILNIINIDIIPLIHIQNIVILSGQSERDSIHNHSPQRTTRTFC